MQALFKYKDLKKKKTVFGWAVHYKSHKMGILQLFEQTWWDDSKQ